MKTCIAAAAVAACMTTAANAQEPPSAGPTLSATFGADYSTGKYGAADDTEIFLAPLSVRAKNGPLRFSATVPYMRVEGPGNVIAGDRGGIIIDPNKPTTNVTRKGVGDVSLSAAYGLPAERLGGFDVDLTAKIKLPTASEDKGLGTGKTDYGVSMDVSRTMGLWSPFITVGYRWLGDPEGVSLRNTVNASVGTSVIVGGRSVVIVSYDYTRAPSRLVDDAHEIFGAFSHPLTQNVNWTLYGVAGLSEGSPDAQGGLALTYRFN